MRIHFRYVNSSATATAIRNAIYHKNEMMTIPMHKWKRKRKEPQPFLFYTHLFGILNIHMKIIMLYSEFEQRMKTTTTQKKN